MGKPESLFLEVTWIILVEICLCVYVYLPLFSSMAICKTNCQCSLCQSYFDGGTKCGLYIQWPLYLTNVCR